MVLLDQGMIHHQNLSDTCKNAIVTQGGILKGILEPNAF